MKSLSLLVLAIALLFSSSDAISATTAADRDRPSAKGQGRGGPPQEAFTACDGLDEGSECSFEDRRGESRIGECIQPPNGDEGLVCLPERGRQGKKGRRGPSQEAIEACGNLSSGDACTFTNPKGESLTGECKLPRSKGTQLSCCPQGRP